MANPGTNYEDRLRMLVRDEPVINVTYPEWMTFSRLEAARLADFVEAARKVIESDDLSCPWMDDLDRALAALDQEAQR